MTRKKGGSAPGSDPLWYKDATIYELHVRSFYDSNADGIGDFPGLIQKLDYLEELGVDTLWLLPFYPSPLKDGGYDISDYCNINPAYGRMEDFEAFLDEAHRRGLRVITELVINHTSDQHPWFQEARRAVPGSRERDFYVWSGTRDKYKGVRIIFQDFESSNWAWDKVAKAYYWHRFYSHQPDLNYDNPAVHQAIFKVVDFWLEKGVDGLRVDAVPYLYEREGTSCENLPETHAFLKKLRAHIDGKFENRLLIAEANQWPEDAVAYFGKGDEFQMAFHFPIMPRLFMAIGTEDRFPIIDILRQTPEIPEDCQWAIFLRNHDELTLEMVTEEERDAMYRVYARDPDARLNLGIRRRLAPLLNNDRRKLELVNALLFSLPGTPVIYYGDELGMGDDIRLSDRDGLRAPMQWSAKKNAGFSRASSARLYLPVITDPAFHYKSVNVAAHQANADSFLSWMKQVIALSKKYQAFGRGTIEFLQPENRKALNHKVLAFLRRYRGETVLVMANLSHLGQQVQLDLSEFNGCRLINLFGRVEFSPVTHDKYPFTLGPYEYYWFTLEPPRRALTAKETAGVSTLVKAADELFEKENVPVMEALLQNYIKGRRWFRSKARDIQSCRIKDIIPVRSPEGNAWFVLVRVDYAEGEPETYAVPLSVVAGEQAGAMRREQPQAVIARLQPPDGGEESLLCDAMADKNFGRSLLESIGRKARFGGGNGRIIASPTPAFFKALRPGETVPGPAPVKVEQTNTSLIYGDRLILKLYRQLGEGVNPELETVRFLAEKTNFANIPPLAGALEYCPKNASPATLAVIQGFVSNEGDAWRYTRDSLESYFQYVLSRPEKPPLPRESLLALPAEIPAFAREAIGPYLMSAQLLGQRTAELHTALASAPDDPDFAPEPFSFVYRTSLYQSLRGQAVRTLQLLRERLPDLPRDIREMARRVIDLEERIVESYRLLKNRDMAAVRIRTHGDFHLGQALYTGRDFVIIDFEGETDRPLSARRRKHSPLRDAAGMIRSFHYAAHDALRYLVEMSPRTEKELSILRGWAQYWYIWVAAAYLKIYLDNIKKAKLLPEDPGQIKILLDAFLLERAVYEIGYELNNRPGWLKVPLEGVLQLMDTRA